MEWCSLSDERDPAFTTRELNRLVRALPPVDEAGVAARCAQLWSRSVKADSQLAGLETAISMVDLTTLEGADSPGRIRALAAKAACPAPGVGPVAAVCVYPDLVAVARHALDASVAGRKVAVASVSSAFPSGRSPLSVKLADTAGAVGAGASEVDVVVDRGALLSGNLGDVWSQLVALRAAAGDAHLKVILESGELGSLSAVRVASWLAMAAGADFIKTSTGKVSEGATPAAMWVMARAVADFFSETGRRVGLKAAGGVRSSKDALRFLVLVAETAGPEWLSPERMRFGASSLLDDLLAQRDHALTGAYGSSDCYSWG